jgi:hypothetical protein
VASKENEKISRLLARLRQQNPAFGEEVFKTLNRFGAQIIGNQVSEPNQAGIFHAVSRMINDFLGITVPILGHITTSRRIRESINERRPILLGKQRDENTKAFYAMAEALLLEDVPLDDLLIEEDEADVQPTAAAEIATAPPRPATGAKKGVEKGSEKAPAAEPAAAPAAAEAPPELEIVEVEDDPSRANPPLEKYTRKHDRFAVDWLASLRTDALLAAVRVHEISAAGAAIECGESFEIGQQVALLFDQLPQRPAATVTVARALPGGYALEGDIPGPVVAAATSGQEHGARLAG